MAKRISLSPAQRTQVQGGAGQAFSETDWIEMELALTAYCEAQLQQNASFPRKKIQTRLQSISDGAQQILCALGSEKMSLGGIRFDDGMSLDIWIALKKAAPTTLSNAEMTLALYNLDASARKAISSLSSVELSSGWPTLVAALLVIFERRGKVATTAGTLNAKTPSVSKFVFFVSQMMSALPSEFVVKRSAEAISKALQRELRAIRSRQDSAR